MALLPGFEYDIFISYRHNDNRSGWVTDFVNALQEELAATIKEPLTIYFDKNPHDGLLETHNVDKSLEGKLKCLIFIPIISQTYCDPKSFAWQHEFLVFNRLAQEDEFGRDIKLNNGNVASRILPIKIHELDADDKAIIENEIGGVLRAIEFIYKESGVNRPLSANDKQEQNQNHTYYKNQLNKVANAIKEIITAIKNPHQSESKQSTTGLQPVPKSRFNKNLIAVVVLLLGALSYFIFQNFSNNQQRTTDNESPIDKSIAVLPFVNMSNDPEQEYFSDGLSEELLNLLAKLPELRVIGRTSSFSFKGKNEDLREIGKKLGTAYLLEGSVRKSGINLRITAQLIETQNGSHVWSETYDRQMNELFAIQDEIASQVVNQLKIKMGVNPNKREKNIEAYKLLLESRFLVSQRLPGFHLKARALIEKALSIDSTDAELWAELVFTINAAPHQNSEQRRLSYELATKAAKKSVELDPTSPNAHSALAEITLFYHWDWAIAEEEYRKVANLDQHYKATYFINTILGRLELALQDALKNLENDPLNPNNWINVGGMYQSLGETNKAIEYNKKLLELTPFSDAAHAQMVTALAEAGRMDEALLELGKMSDKDSPRFLSLNARISHYLGDNQKALDYLNDLIASDEKPVDNSYSIAQLLSQQGEKNEAIRWLNIAYERRNPTLVYLYAITSRKLGINKKWLPSFYNLREEPQFKELLRIMNFPDTYEN
jgi:adenylate cyclase